MAPDGSAELVVVEGGLAHVRKIVMGLSESDHVEVVGTERGRACGHRGPDWNRHGTPLAEESEGDEDDDDEDTKKDDKGDKGEGDQNKKDEKSSAPATKEPKSEKK